MPIGVIVNVCSVLLGGLAGTIFKDKLSQRLKTEISLIFGICSMGMGISSIVLMKNMPAVVFSIILGTILGILLNLNHWINQLANGLKKTIALLFKQNTTFDQKEMMNELVTVIILFCASGTGIYGAMVSGMTLDHSVLIAKSILDFFTAAIFACKLGVVVSAVALPQLVVELTLFFAAGLILPLASAEMIADFKACGGFLMLATGFRMMKIKDFPIADMLPAMILVMPMSWFWANVILSWI